MANMMKAMRGVTSGMRAVVKRKMELEAKKKAEGLAPSEAKKLKELNLDLKKREAEAKADSRKGTAKASATKRKTDENKSLQLDDMSKGYKSGGYVAGGPNRMKKTGHTDSCSGITRKKKK